MRKEFKINQLENKVLSLQEQLENATFNNIQKSVIQ